MARLHSESGVTKECRCGNVCAWNEGLSEYALAIRALVPDLLRPASCAAPARSSMNAIIISPVTQSFETIICEDGPLPGSPNPIAHLRGKAGA